ncbi:hypothetical protein PHYPO_G00078390 [Pangasianodon hypophthalmus]|uniref:Ras-related protein Rab-3 n=2 Tax=Pangasianodon TaxID=30992 RepID=A0A5N5LL26_PANHP|nr:hypothetical protein PHYPO_G00078390 [Pangasianodon hypophthalmus]
MAPEVTQAVIANALGRVPRACSPVRVLSSVYGDAEEEEEESASAAAPHRAHISSTSRQAGRQAGIPPSLLIHSSPVPKYTGAMRQDGSMQMAAPQKETADQNFDYMFKLLIIGNSSVGKTSFLFRYADDSFTSAFVSTVGIDFKVKTVYKNDKRIKLQIWDTAGQERYRTITTAYYRGAMGFILMYDITNEESFGAVQDWSTQIKTYSWDNAQVILAGNKCDMEEERVVSVESGRLLAEQLGFEFFETSAKDNINVKQTFERLVDIICDKMSESLETDPAVTTGTQGNARLTDNPPPLQQPNCAC